MKITQIYYYDPQSAGINVQSPQTATTPRRLTLTQQDEFRNKKKDRLIPSNLYSRAYSSSYSCSDLLDNAPLNAVANDSHVYNNAQWPEFQNVVQKHTMADVSML